jgi:hypothetical protein
VGESAGRVDDAVLELVQRVLVTIIDWPISPIVAVSVFDVESTGAVHWNPEMGTHELLEGVPPPKTPKENRAATTTAIISIAHP